MPRLSNPKHEKYARYRAMGEYKATAYFKAGYEPHRQNASRLEMANDDIKKRVAELQELAATEGNITPETILGALLKEATEGDTPGARVRALELLGKTEAGGKLFADKLEVDDKRGSLEEIQRELVAKHGPEMAKAIVKNEGLPWMLGDTQTDGQVH